MAEWLKAHKRAPRAALHQAACALVLEYKERWPSGLRRTLGKRVYGQPYRGFESLSLRHPQGETNWKPDFPDPTDRIENLSVPASCATNLWTHAAHKCCRRHSFRAAFPPNLGIADCPNSIPTSYAFENVRFFHPFRAQDPQRNPPGAETSNHDLDISLF